MKRKKKLEIPDWMIYQSFKYCFRSHSTFPVIEFVDWAKRNWVLMPEMDKFFIMRDLKGDLSLKPKDIRELWVDLLRYATLFMMKEGKNEEKC